MHEPGTWLVIIILCQLSWVNGDCPVPEELPNGKLNMETLSDVGRKTVPLHYVIHVECNKGYWRFGNPLVVCQGDTWRWPGFPTCKHIATELSCPDPPVVPFAKASMTQPKPWRAGTRVAYICDRNYELASETNTLRCGFKKSKLRWLGELPRCVELLECPDPGVSVDGSRSGSCCHMGDVLSFTCNDSFVLIGDEDIVCQEESQWSATRPSCRPQVSCPEPLLPNGTLIRSRMADFFAPDDEVQVSCDEGFQPSGGRDVVYCKPDGHWDDVIATCQEIRCQPPEIPQNGSLKNDLNGNDTHYPYEFTVYYECDEGFYLDGPSWRTCSEFGWTGSMPTCKIIRCPDPGTPEDGWRQGDSFEIGDRVIFGCFPGYTLIGSEERICMDNGQWSGELTRCNHPGNHCPNPGIPINGMKLGNRYGMFDEVRFYCSPGFILVGSANRTCTVDGFWRGDETQCIGERDFHHFTDLSYRLQSAIYAKQVEQAALTKDQFSAKDSISPEARILDLKFSGRLILYFILDASGSVGEVNFDKSLQFTKALIEKIGVSGNGMRVGVITFSSKTKTEFQPVDYENTQSVIEAIDRIKFSAGGTATTTALRDVREKMIPLANRNLGPSKIKSVVFLITDGKSNMGGSPKTEADVLKKDGVEIYCIGITGSVRKKALYEIASSKKEHVFILENYETMDWLIQDITNGTVDYSTCGLGQTLARNLPQRAQRDLRARIIGGAQADVPWPWMAALYFRDMPGGQPRLQCGGSIVDGMHILTAAHCLEFKDFAGQIHLRRTEDVVVKLGLLNVKNATHLLEPEVLELIPHPDYNRTTVDNDVALIRFSQPITYNPFVRPVCLPPAEDEIPPESELYQPNQNGYVIGWGYDKAATEAQLRNATLRTVNVLKQIRVPLQSRDACLDSVNKLNLLRPTARYKFTPAMICAGDGKGTVDSCRGDSGGPLMQFVDSADAGIQWFQVGTVSWGVGCGQHGTYGYYTNIAHLKPWIDQIITGRGNV